MAKYKIKTTSSWCRYVKPYSKAVAEFSPDVVEEWVTRRYLDGKNIPELHEKCSVTEQDELHLKMRLQVPTWYVELNTLDDLFQLINDVGFELVIGSDQVIEIYDDFRE